MGNNTGAPPPNQQGGQSGSSGARWYARLTAKMNPPVFFASAGAVIAFVALGGSFSQQTAAVFGHLQNWIVNQFGWFYILVASLLLAGILALLFTRWGSVKLGRDDEEPEFRLPMWFAMLFAAGMGIGIVFFGVAEPLQHYLSPPEGDGRTQESLDSAMRWTFFHWGFHPWAIYAAFALPLAYLHFRKGMPLAPRSMLYPLLGERINGWIGHLTDTFCTVGTLLGVATSLGLGSIQINAGLGSLFGLTQGTGHQALIIAAITTVATVSVVSGLSRGIRGLSTFNIALGALILAFVFLAGPTVFALDLFVNSLGNYLQHLPGMSFRIAPGVEGGWQADWTLFYWSWWISWSPFVGVFVARISRGRTVREFILAALLVPALAGFAWFSVMGGAGVYFEQSAAGDIAGAATDDVRGSSLFAVLNQLPGSEITTALALVLVAVFFVTSSDSGSFVDDMVTSGGHPDPPRSQRVFWAISEGAVAATLLFAGGLQALRTAALTTGLPVSIILILSMIGLFRMLKREPAFVSDQGQPTEGSETS